MFLYRFDSLPQTCLKKATKYFYKQIETILPTIFLLPSPSSHWLPSTVIE